MNLFEKIFATLGQCCCNERLLLFRGINSDVDTLGQCCCMERLPFFRGINPASAWRLVVSWQHPAPRQGYATAKSPPPDTREWCPFIINWQCAALCQSCQWKDGPSLTQKRVHCPVLCHGDATAKSTTSFSGGGILSAHGGSVYLSTTNW